MSGGSGEAVLVLEPPAGDDSGACLDMLTRGAGPTSVLSVLADESVDERTTRLDQHPGAVTGAAFVTVNPADSELPTDVDAVRTVGSPGDLTGIGVGVTDWLTARTDGEACSVCVDGVSTLLQYSDVERVFRLLHVLVGKCRQQGTHVHVHLTPSAHEDRTVATLRQLFDDQHRVHSAESPESDASEGSGVRIDAADNPGD